MRGLSENLQCKNPSFFINWLDPLDLSKRKKLLDLCCICPRGTREGTPYFFFEKSVFVKHTTAYATAMSVITWQNETFRGRGGHLLHCIAKGRSVVGISAFFRHTLIKVRLHISVRLTSVFISAPSF